MKPFLLRYFIQDSWNFIAGVSFLVYRPFKIE